VSDASARALGKIGGSRSAQALVEAIRRRGVSRRLVAELARGAPDQFIESSLALPLKPGVRPALALAAGLRRRRTATSQLIALVEHGSRRERVISCRALGWIGAVTAVPVLIEALQDRDWKLRMSAAKALGALRARDAAYQLRGLLSDRNPRVRKAAAQALGRIGR
jgi:HEAT repeat protein